MDFALSPSEEAFRRDLRWPLRDNAPGDWIEVRNWFLKDWPRRLRRARLAPRLWRTRGHREGPYGAFWEGSARVLGLPKD